MHKSPLLSFIFLLFFSALAQGHGGGLDDQGGHTDRRSGQYHCHREPCFSIQEQSRQALDEARSESRPFSTLYDRDDWPHWSDGDGDGYNTRHQLLRERSQVQADSVCDAGRCRVLTGYWFGPYSGRHYTRAGDLDADHIIPLKWAHGHGGDHWPPEQKARFANDPDNVLLVDDGLNQSKGAQPPWEWLPPRSEYHCDYIRLWQRLLQRYELTLYGPEVTAWQQQRAACRGEGAAPTNP